ncbi:MAG: uracil-DNA glycosylase [Desulfurivibrio sp.]
MSDAAQIQLEDSWKQRLLPEFSQPYMRNLKSFLLTELAAGKTVYPKGAEMFAALNLIPFNRVKVVILGQDPYHGPNQAHGLCFSVRPGTAIPPSLLNIYKELKEDVGFTMPGHGYLQSWAEQGVLLLNATLSVQAGLAGSHQGKGWEQFTDRIVHLLNEEGEHLVFMLWGSYAQKKGSFIDPQRHLVLKAPHPSPLSAHRGFFGCRHFSRANRYLEAHGKTPVNWQLPSST